jgi:hypothetical protein
MAQNSAIDVSMNEQMAVRAALLSLGENATKQETIKLNALKDNEEATKNTAKAASKAAVTSSTSDNIKTSLYNNFMLGNGSGLVGGDSGVVKQSDNKYSNLKFGDGTVATKGCGPSVASMVLEDTMGSSIDFAKQGGYVRGGGTEASYFKDYLGSRGIATQYMDRSSQIQSGIKSGSPTILLGQDTNNRSKSNSPFGPNPHYVLASGTDRKGNIIVKDPETGVRTYDKSILNNVKLGIATGAGAFKRSKRKYNRFFGGAPIMETDGGEIVTEATYKADVHDKKTYEKGSTDPNRIVDQNLKVYSTIATSDIDAAILVLRWVRSSQRLS